MSRRLLMRSNIFEVVWPAVFLGQEGFTVVELAGSAAGALGGVGAVEVRGVAVSDVAEPETRRVSTIVNEGWGRISTHQ